MTIPSELNFALLHYYNRKENVVLVILYLVTNPLISYMVFLSDIQKLSIASHLNGMDSSFQFCFHMQGGKDEPLHQFSFRIKIDVLVLTNI